MEFKPKNKTTDFILHIFYKTLDNEINANVAQTYIYLKSFGPLSKSDYINRLYEYKEWLEYINILKVDINILLKNIDRDEIEEFNNILIKNDVKTISINNLNVWLEHWFKIFKRKSNKYLIRSERIIDEVIKDYKHFEGYSTYPNEYKIVNYQEYLKKE